MRAAIVHYWLLNMRGGEQVVEALCRLLPEADIFTLFYDPAQVSDVIRSRKVHASFLNPLRRGYRSLLPLMPIALESFDLRDYDLVISSESGPAKGVIVPSHTRHICYCHTPMRYLWEFYPEYLRGWGGARWRRALMAPFANYLRLWDYASAARVDRFLANSRNVAQRILKTYRRNAEVVYPPVPVEQFSWKPPEEFYFIVSELVPYKRIDVAVRAFSRSGRKLRIAGAGPEIAALRRMAGPNVEFCGHVSDSERNDLYSRCRALVMTAEEDFGLTAIEALASGKPVITLGRGGACESVPAGGGIFYSEQTADALEDAILRFEEIEESFDVRVLQGWASQFSEQRFAEKMTVALA